MNPAEVAAARRRRLEAEAAAKVAPTYEDVPVPEVCVCGKRQYTTRKKARAVIRREFPGEKGLHAYACGGWFHIGHFPARVVSGDKPRSAIARVPQPKADKGFSKAGRGSRGPRA